MNSAMNIEFVYFILIGINNFMENFCEKDGDIANHDEILKMRDGKKVGETKTLQISKDSLNTKITFQ